MKSKNFLIGFAMLVAFIGIVLGVGEFRIDYPLGTSWFIVNSTGNVTMTQLASCDTIDTDVNGVLSCGTDADTTYTFLGDLLTTAPLLIDAGGNVDDIIYGANTDYTFTVQKLTDLVVAAPLTGGGDDTITGIDADINLGITVDKDLIGHAPILLNGTAVLDDILVGADGDINISLAVCGDTEIYKYNATAIAWECEADVGGSGLDNVVEDTTPTLGGNLDLAAFAIDSGAGTSNITIDASNNVIISLQ